MPEGTAALNLAFSRDGRWFAATGFNPVVALFSEDGRLAHRLTREGAKARAAVPSVDFGGDAVFWWTNLRVVEDTAAASGYKLDISPFPGWRDAPPW